LPAVKYIIFFGALLMGLPLLTAWLLSHPRRVRLMATMHAFSIAFSVWVTLNFFPGPALSRHGAGDRDHDQRPFRTRPAGGDFSA